MRPPRGHAPSRRPLASASYSEYGGELYFGGDPSSNLAATNFFDFDDFRVDRFALSEQQVRTRMLAEAPAASQKRT